MSRSNTFRQKAKPFENSLVQYSISLQIHFHAMILCCVLAYYPQTRLIINCPRTSLFQILNSKKFHKGTDDGFQICPCPIRNTLYKIAAPDKYIQKYPSKGIPLFLHKRSTVHDKRLLTTNVPNCK